MSKLLDVIAPRFSRRRLGLSIARDFYRRPVSIIGRLSPINRHNARVFAPLRMHCNVCGREGSMAYDYPDVRLRKAHGIGLLRETLRCKFCGCSMRDRQLASGLICLIAQRLGRVVADLQSFRERPQGTLRILDSDSFSSINKVMRGVPGYNHSQFLPHMKNGERLADGSLNVNLEEMPFSDGAFDIILTSDVMEHVADDERAHREILRCLAPGGTYLFTVPFDSGRQGHLRLTQRVGPNMPVLLDKHIHGDPHANSGILAHRIYGLQLLDDLRALGYKAIFKDLNQAAHGIFGGDLFVAEKEH